MPFLQPSAWLACCGTRSCSSWNAMKQLYVNIMQSVRVVLRRYAERILPTGSWQELKMVGLDLAVACAKKLETVFTH